jgi:hypothetical protein
LVTSCCLLAILVGFSFSSPKQQTSLRNTRKETSQCTFSLCNNSHFLSWPGNLIFL